MYVLFRYDKSFFLIYQLQKEMEMYILDISKKIDERKLL